VESYRAWNIPYTSVNTGQKLWAFHVWRSEMAGNTRTTKCSRY
jgi:hypothetical protein